MSVPDIQPADETQAEAPTPAPPPLGPDGRPMPDVRWWDVALLPPVSIGFVFLVSFVLAFVYGLVAILSTGTAPDLSWLEASQNTGSFTELAFWSTLALAIPLFAAGWLLFWLRGSAFFRAFYRKAPPVHFVWAAILAFAVVPLISLLFFLLPETVQTDLERMQLDMVPTDALGWAYLALAAVVLAPIIEEFYFRGVLFTWLVRKTPLMLAVGLSAAAFTVVHGLTPALAGSGTIFANLQIFVLGCLFALLYRYSGSLWVPMLAHGTYNALVILSLAAVSQMEGVGA